MNLFVLSNSLSCTLAILNVDRMLGYEEIEQIAAMHRICKALAVV